MSTSEPQVTIRLTHSKIDPAEALDQIAAPENGALNLFLGVTRNHHQGRGVLGLDYKCYEEMAEPQLRKVALEVAEKHGIGSLLVIHRLGEVGIGETSLLVAAGSHHRHQALDGTLELINRLKLEVPIWKRERFADGSIGWVEGAAIVPSAD